MGGNASNPSNMLAGLQEPSNFSFVSATYDVASPDNCMVEVSLVSVPTSESVFVRVRQSTNNSVLISYDDVTKNVVFSGIVAPVNVPVKPQALGIALANGKVNYLYRLSNLWYLGGSITRPGYLNSTVSVGFGIVGVSNSQSATFDDWNTTPILKSSL